MRNIDCHLANLSFSWPQGREILHDISGTYVLDGVVALCGANGCGKSTLLALLAGQLAPTSGRIRLSENDVVLESQRLGSLEASPGQSQRARLDLVFRDTDNLLLLDEPTNHLDVEALAELEHRLRRRRSPTILVSHDRDLLDRIAKRTLWLEDGALVSTEGGFTNAWREREARLAKRLAQRESHDSQVRALSARMQASREESQTANRHRTAGRRMKDPNDRDATSMAADFKFRTAQTSLGQNMSRLRGELERVESQASIVVKRDTLRDIEFPWSKEMASRRLALPAGMVIAPDGLPIAHDGIALDGRTRVRLDGPNGSGKSTLLGALAALERPGVVHLPQEPTREQDIAFLESLRGSSPSSLGRILTLAAALGASGEALRATASPSPGEARKLRLAAALASPSWMLLLDEPTNHLDAASIQRLQEALARWPGGLVIATHDIRLATATTDLAWTLRERRLIQRG